MLLLLHRSKNTHTKEHRKQTHARNHTPKTKKLPVKLKCWNALSRVLFSVCFSLLCVNLPFASLWFFIIGSLYVAFGFLPGVAALSSNELLVLRGFFCLKTAENAAVASNHSTWSDEQKKFQRRSGYQCKCICVHTYKTNRVYTFINILSSCIGAVAMSGRGVWMWTLIFLCIKYHFNNIFTIAPNARCGIEFESYSEIL